MRFSVKAILMCMLIAALFAWSHRQQQEITQAQLRTTELSQIVSAEWPAAELAARKTKVCEDFIAWTKTQPSEYNAALVRFRVLQEKHGKFARQKGDEPLYKPVPSVRDREQDELTFNLFIPNKGRFAIRVAVIETPDVRRPWRQPKKVVPLEQSPFEPTASATFELGFGEHVVHTSWTKAGEFRLDIDGETEFETKYTARLSPHHAYAALQSHTGEGRLRTRDTMRGLRSITPLHVEAGDESREHTLRCDLIRVDDVEEATL